MWASYDDLLTVWSSVIGLIVMNWKVIYVEKWDFLIQVLFCKRFSWTKVSCIGVAFGAEKSKAQNLEALQAKFDGVVHKTDTASPVITVGGAVIYATAFTGSNYLVWVLSGVTQLSKNKVCHDQAPEVYQAAYMKYTCDRTILLDWVATNAQIKEAKQNFTDTDYTFTLQPSTPWQMNYTPRDYKIIVTRLMPKNYLKPQGHQKKLQKSGWSKQALCKIFLPAPRCPNPTWCTRQTLFSYSTTKTMATSMANGI